MPGLEFLEDSDEEMSGLLLLLVDFLFRVGVARGKRLCGSNDGVNSLIRVLKAKLFNDLQWVKVG